MKKKLNIGILSDSAFLVTGYATIAREIANILADDGHNVYFFGSNYIGQNLEPGIKFEDGKELKFRMIGQGREAYFKDLLPIHTKQYNLDILIVLLDTFMVYPWFQQLDLSPAKVIWYFPSDGGGGMPLGCENVLRAAHAPVAMAKFGQKQVEKMYGIKCHHIPHAVDVSMFHPVSEERKLELKRSWSLQDKFVVGVVARNQGRKMLDRTIKAFALYAPKNPNAILLMHTDPDDAAQVFHLPSLINRYGLANRVLFTGMRYYKGFNYSQMNDIYNLMDVFLLTTSGEGFGIPIIEAMAAEIPVIATDYTTSRELVKDNKAGFVIDLVGDTEDENIQVHTSELLDGTITGSWNVERGMCSIKDAAKKLEMLGNNPDLRKELGRNGRLAVLKDYDWRICGKQWIELVTKLGGEY